MLIQNLNQWIDAIDMRKYNPYDNMNPGELHWTAVKNILKYLRNTKDMFLVYGGNPSTELKVKDIAMLGYELNRDSLSLRQGNVFV
ncbi:hypothetical protein Tco_1183581 [Tanacetum coccineum]